MHLITWNNTIFNNVHVFLVSRICCDYILFTNYISGFSKQLNWGNDLFKSRGGEVISYNDPPLNKQLPTSMAFCTTLSICDWNHVHSSSNANWMVMKVEGKCLPVSPVWFQAPIWLVSVNSVSAACFQRTRLTISTGLIAVLGKERHGDGNEVLEPQSRSTRANYCN